MTILTRRASGQGSAPRWQRPRARRTGAARVAQGLGAERRPGSRSRAPSSRCCAGNLFVQAEDDAFVNARGLHPSDRRQGRASTRESCEDVQPKASVAANTGAGPDLFWGLYSLPHLFPQKLLDVSDVAEYLGKKYGGWVPSARHLRQERRQMDRGADRLRRQPA